LKILNDMENIENKTDLSVVTYSPLNGNEKYSHWSKDLTMIISKGDVSITLKGDEIREIIKSLPRTIGGTY